MISLVKTRGVAEIRYVARSDTRRALESLIDFSNLPWFSVAPVTPPAPR